MVRLVLRPGLHATRRRDASDGALRQAYHSRFPLAAEAWTARNRLICRPDRGREIEGPRIHNATCCPTRASVCLALKPDTRLEAREAGEGVRNTEYQGSVASNPRALNWAGMDEFLVGGRPRSSQSGIIHFALSKSRSGGSQ